MTEIIHKASIVITSIDHIIKILPEQGCIEIQRDAPGKRHDWHRHAHNETLSILKGAITFSLEGGEHPCGPGAVVRLCAHQWQQSGAQGAIYIIAFRDLPIPGQ